MKEEISARFNKKTAVVAIASFALVAGGTAAVLTYVGQSQGEVSVDSAITINGNTEWDDSEDRFSVDGSTGGGAVASETFTLQNRAEEVIPTSLMANTTIQNSNQDTVNADPEGVNSSFVFYTQTNFSGSSYGVDVDVVTDQSDVESGNYDLNVTSDEETRDYATVWYPADVDSKPSLTVQGTTNADAGNNGVDEVYVLTEDGELAASTNTDLSSFQETSSIEWNTVKAIGLGYGNADSDSQAGAVTVSTVIEEVSIAGEVVSENGEDINSLPLNPTGTQTFEVNGQEFTVDSRHNFQFVTDFSNSFYTDSGNEVRTDVSVEIAE
jgi:hypothetical protein